MRLLPLCLLLCLLSACNRHQSALPEPSTAIDTSLLRDGDLIFRLGRGLESHAVTVADKRATYSHTGLLVHQQEGWKVLHAVPGESEETEGKEVIKQDAISLFLRSDRCIKACVMRYDTNVEARALLRQEALRLYGKALLFDHSYDKTDSTKMYCTEYVCHVYQAIGVDLAEGRCHRFPMAKEPVIYPLDLRCNKRLTTVWSSEK